MDVKYTKNLFVAVSSKLIPFQFFAIKKAWTIPKLRRAEEQLFWICHKIICFSDIDRVRQCNIADGVVCVYKLVLSPVHTSTSMQFDFLGLLSPLRR